MTQPLSNERIEQIVNPEVKELVVSTNELIKASPKRNPGKILHCKMFEINTSLEEKINQFFQEKELVWTDFHSIDYNQNMTQAVIIYSQQHEHIAQNEQNKE